MKTITRSTALFCLVSLVMILDGMALGQLRSRAPAAANPAQDGISWLHTDFSKTLELHPAAIEGSMSISARAPGRTSSDIPLRTLPANWPDQGVSMGLVQDPQGQFPVIVYNSWSTNQVAIQKCNASVGTADQPVELVRWSTPLAISPGGTRMISSFRLPGRGGGTLDLWSLEGSPRLVNHLDVSGDAPEGMTSVHPTTARSQAIAVTFLDSKHFAEIDGFNGLSLWELSDTSATEIYHIAGDVPWRISADARSASGIYSKRIVILELATGKCSWIGDIPNKIGGTICISPSAQRILITGLNSTALDLQKNQVVPCGTFNSDAGAPWWVDDNLLFVGSTLYDVNRHNTVWTYRSRSRIGFVMRPGGGVWYLKESTKAPNANPTYVLAWAKIPDDAAIAADAKSPVAPLLAGPKSKITIVLHVEVLGKDEKDLLMKRLVELLGENEMTNAPGQPVQLVAELKQLRTFTNTISDANSTKTAKVHSAQYTTSLSFQIKGKKLWETGGLLNGTGFANPKRGQTFEQAIAAFEAENRPKAAMLTRQVDHLPANIFDAAEPTKIGYTDFSAIRSQ